MRLLTCNSCGKSVEYQRRGKAPKVFYCGECSEGSELVLYVDRGDVKPKQARLVTCSGCASVVEWRKRGRTPKSYLCEACSDRKSVTVPVKSADRGSPPPYKDRNEEFSRSFKRKIKTLVFRKDLPVEVGDEVLFVPWGLYPESVLPERARRVKVVEISEDRRIAKVSLPQYTEPQTTRLSNLCHFEEVESEG